MGSDLSPSRAFGKYILYLFSSLLVATITGFFLGGDPGPGTPERLILIGVFFSVFTLLFLWDAEYLNR